MEYILLDSDDKIERACQAWAKKERIAVDFECEFNLHVYGEHLCLIQIYDLENFFIIDVRSKGVTTKGLEQFFSIKTKKVWFDCQSDHSLVYKNYKLKIVNILDIRVLAQALGFQGNLISLEKEYLGIEININKKKNQQANWMKRPISEENLEYALLDVKYLLDLEDVLAEKIKDMNLTKNVDSRMKHVTSTHEPEPGWMHIGSWRHYSEKQKALVKNIYLSRDSIARRFNVPASRVLDKHMIIDLATNMPKTDEELDKRLKDTNPRFISFVIPAIKEAFSKTRKEIGL